MIVCYSVVNTGVLYYILIIHYLINDTNSDLLRNSITYACSSKSGYKTKAFGLFYKLI